jgi:D-amino-acid dehydrogenase
MACHRPPWRTALSNALAASRIVSMHVMVLGAGVTGVTTAWYLRERGFDVSVVDRQPGPALETSFANGGQISISHPEPWSSPAAPWIALRALGRRDAPLRLKPGLDPARWRWLAGFLLECLPQRHHRNAEAIARLAVHSGACLRTLRDRTGLHYEEQTRGILHLFFERSEYEKARAKIAFLARHGIAARLCDAHECVTLEPALRNSHPPLVGGIHALGDESGNAMQFTRELARRCAQAGVQFHFETTVEKVAPDARGIVRVVARTADGNAVPLQADAWVVCLGSHGPALLEGAGEHLAIYPVKGYSVTAPVVDPARAPNVSLTDESRRIVCSRLGDTLRVAGTAEICGFDTSVHADRCRALLDWAESMFPGALDTAGATPWAGLRPCTPSNVPYIGRSRWEGLWLNTGHGSLGWTLACGSAHCLAEMMSGRAPPVAGFPFRGAQPT